MKNELKTMLAIYGAYKLVEPFAEAVVEAVQEATKWAKEDRRKNEVSKWRKPYISYASYNKNVRTKVSYDSKDDAQWLVNKILFDSREDAIAALKDIEEMLNNYSVVRVCDVLDLVGDNCPDGYFDAAMGYGWKNDSSRLAYTPTEWKIKRWNNSWEIKFPEVERL